MGARDEAQYATEHRTALPLAPNDKNKPAHMSTKPRLRSRELSSRRVLPSRRRLHRPTDEPPHTREGGRALSPAPLVWAPLEASFPGSSLQASRVPEGRLGVQPGLAGLAASGVPLAPTPVDPACSLLASRGSRAVSSIGAPPVPWSPVGAGLLQPGCMTPLPRNLRQGDRGGP